MKCSKCNSDNADTQQFCGECGSKLVSVRDIPALSTKSLVTVRMELTTGSVFAGRYKIVEELGKGGMGKVYKAIDKQLNEDVALKLIKPEIASDKKTIKRFRNELKLSRKISHRNVGRMYELMEDKGSLFITMEYVPGQDLKGLIRQSGRLAIGTTISIAKQVCEGLTEAHRLGVIHRDLKPNNIMIDKGGNARIMDFGIARSLTAKSMTRSRAMVGTPEYMSPEQAEAEELDHRSDIYSLGVIFYEMVTGQLPFEGETPLSIAMKHKGEIPTDPKELNPQISADLSQLILKCMEKDRENRYQDTEELRLELTNIEMGIPTTERVIPRKKTLTSKEITVTLSFRKFFILAFIIVALVITAVVIWQLLPKKETNPVAPSGKPSLAIMYFKNNTGDKSLDHWRTMLSNLLVADLTQSKHIRVLSEDKLFNILNQLNQLEAETYSSEVLEKVAAQGRVNHVLQGAYAKVGDEFKINVLLQEASTGELIGSESVAAKGESSIFSVVDELTIKIKSNFKLSAEEIASDIDKQIGKITTSSPEAYKYYSEGMKFYNKGDYRKSIQFMERALAIDSEFAMTYRSMAWSYQSLNYPAMRKKYLQKALELSGRLSERERYLIQGDFYGQLGGAGDDKAKAIEAYNRLLQIHPKDSLGNLNLGQLYMDLEQWDKAIERFEVLRQNKDSAIQPYISLSTTYEAKGFYDKSKEVLDYYLNNFSDNAIIHKGLAHNYLFQGQYDLALGELDEALFLDPGDFTNFETRGHIYTLKGDLIKAEKEFQRSLKTEEQAEHQWVRGSFGAFYLLEGKFGKSKDQFKQGLELVKKLGEEGSESGFYSRLAYAYLRSGNSEEALEESKKVERSDIDPQGCLFCHQKWAVLYKGLAYIEMKSLDRAQITADELRELIQKGLNKKYMRLYYHLMGMIELEREDFIKAIEYFKKSISLLRHQSSYINFNDHALLINSLALAYYKDGDFKKAIEEYEKIISLTGGRLSWGDIYAKSFYMLGKIYEQKGQKDEAIEHYEKFLDLWKNADPGIAEVEDARKRLAGLKS
jgi:serine/threonine protein kinase/predicted negative regulator of RcsB-dependent stress response